MLEKKLGVHFFFFSIIDITHFATSVFVNSLPSCAVFRVWDRLLCGDGARALFETALGALSVCRQKLLKTDEAGN